MDKAPRFIHGIYAQLCRRAQILSCLTEGNSIRATCRMTGAAKNTVTKLLVDVGNEAWEYQEKTLRNLPCKRILVDEIWAFVHPKQKKVPEEFNGQFGYGDVWTWTAIDANTKLVPSWYVATRSTESAVVFINDLASRLADRIQLTTDGQKPHLEAVEGAFGGRRGLCRAPKDIRASSGASEAVFPASVHRRQACTDRRQSRSEAINTSYVARQNPTMRMQTRRITRLTNAFSKKVENLAAAVPLHYMAYNFARVHHSLRITPAMAAGVADQLWSMEEIADLLPEPVAKKRGPYKKRNSN